jgi:hypothetical protein
MVAGNNLTRYYTPYLQPTPSLGTGSRVAGSMAVATRPRIGGAGRVYSYFQSIGKEQQYINTLIFAIYGVKR